MFDLMLAALHQIRYLKSSFLMLIKVELYINYAGSGWNVIHEGMYF